MVTFLPEIDDVIRRLDHVESALDQDHRAEDARVVPAALDLAELAGELHALCFAAAERHRLEHFGDVLALVSHLERVLAVARTFATRAEELDVGHEGAAP